MVKSIVKRIMVSRLGQRVESIFRLIRWNARSLAAEGRKPANRRLLMLYDFATQPLSIGDILMFQVASLILRQRYGIDRVDLALVYEPASPVVPDPAYSAIGSDNFMWHLSAVLPAAQVNPHLGSLLLFDSHANLERFILRHLDEYEVWPSLARYASREYVYYSILNKLVFEYFQEFGSVPHLRSRSPARNWARSFLARHAAGRVPVTVQLRRNPANPARDSDYECWRSFFRRVDGRYPAMFVLICGADEVDPGFRNLPNVLLAKDHGTNVEQDLALIEEAAVHMGASSGPGMIALFNDKPYCFFNTDLKPQNYRVVVDEGSAIRFSFAGPMQKFVKRREDVDLVLAEFERMWAVLPPSAPNAAP